MSSAPSRSSPADPVSAALQRGVDRVVAHLERCGSSHPVVLVDGRSGAGKTSFTRALVAAWPTPVPVQVVALDSVYPGWDGLDAGVRYALTDILAPHARGEIGTWRRWDWGADARAEAHTVDPALPLVVEGAGILTPETAPRAEVRVWLESPAASRHDRAIRRDGDTYAPHWERWAAQEEEHLRRHDPRAQATVVVHVP